MRLANDRLWHEPADPGCPLNGRYRVIKRAGCIAFIIISPLHR